MPYTHNPTLKQILTDLITTCHHIHLPQWWSSEGKAKGPECTDLYLNPGTAWKPWRSMRGQDLPTIFKSRGHTCFLLCLWGQKPSTLSLDIDIFFINWFIHFTSCTSPLQAPPSQIPFHYSCPFSLEKGEAPPGNPSTLRHQIAAGLN